METTAWNFKKTDICFKNRRILKNHEYPYGMQNCQTFHLRPVSSLKSRYSQLFSEDIGVRDTISSSENDF